MSLLLRIGDAVCQKPFRENVMHAYTSSNRHPYVKEDLSGYEATATEDVI